ncbi:MAG: hypothetical protein JWM27_1070 [Gemmatimonadetes bacterium]|nr:hypothetical protein [Gemmatimonadota bacterium]
MKALRRVLSLVLALGILAGVIQLGIRSGKNPNYVVWFGIASAIAAPLGLALLGSAFSRNNGIIERLSKVPEIERMISEAESREERIRLLEQQHERLVATVRLESRRQAAVERRVVLENEALRLIEELRFVDEEIAMLDGNVEDGPARAEVLKLYERVRARRTNDVVFQLAGKFYRIDVAAISALLPIAGPIVNATLLRVRATRGAAVGKLMTRASVAPTEETEVPPPPVAH